MRMPEDFPIGCKVTLNIVGTVDSHEMGSWVIVKSDNNWLHKIYPSEPGLILLDPEIHPGDIWEKDDILYVAIRRKTEGFNFWNINNDSLYGSTNKFFNSGNTPVLVQRIKKN